MATIHRLREVDTGALLLKDSTILRRGICGGFGGFGGVGAAGAAGMVSASCSESSSTDQPLSPYGAIRSFVIRHGRCGGIAAHERAGDKDTRGWASAAAGVSSRRVRDRRRRKARNYGCRRSAYITYKAGRVSGTGRERPLLQL
jgi:hypothetical protein